MKYYDMNNYNDYGSPYMETTLIGIMMICFIVVLVCAIFALLSYILKGVGMYTMAKRQGMDNAWLAFIPFARTYLHGELAGSIRLKNKSIQNPGIWLLALPFLYSAVYSLFNGILWFIGFGAITKIFQYDLLYGRVDMSAGSVMGMVVMFVIIAVISVLYTAVYKAFGILVDHQILGRFTSKNMSIAHAVLGALIPLYESICFFVMRNHPFNPGMEPPKPKPFMQSPPPGSYYGAPVPPPEPPVPPVQPKEGGYAGSTSGREGHGDFTSIPPIGGNLTDSAAVPPKQENYGFGAVDFGNGESAFGISGSGSTGSILESESPGENTGLSESEDSGKSTGMPEPGSFGKSAGILDASDSGTAGSPEEKTESQVNFVLPGDENKEF